MILSDMQERSWVWWLYLGWMLFVFVSFQSYLFFLSLFILVFFVFFSIALFIYYIRYKQVVVNKVGNLLITFECIYCVGFQVDT